MVETFLQDPPRLGNQFYDDRVLRAYLERVLPEEVRREVEPELVDLGELAGGRLYEMQLADRLSEPRLTRYDAWGRRIDHIEPTLLWREAERLAAERGLVATAYERAHGRFSRTHQFALVYLFTASTDVYSCPLAMTDGAARTLLASGNRRLIDRAVPHLTSRDPARFWTSGQWMTETTGGSDVGRSETRAVRVAGAAGGGAGEADAGTAGTGNGGEAWRLHGRKWFTSAAASQMALTLARPEGNGPGGRGLALFYIECRDADGLLRGIRVERLKDKLGTRKLPTAELDLLGTPAELVMGPTDGVRNMVPMLVLTRTWNGVSALAFLRRGLALARDYARRRIAFGAPLAEKALHLDTLAGVQAELEGAFHLVFRVIDLLGREEAGELGGAGREGSAAAGSESDGARLLRVLTPLAKLTTGRQVVAGSSEIVESFGGAGYVEDTGIPTLLRDAQVLSIWEGTTNVLALDTLRALGQGEEAARTLALLEREVRRAVAGAEGREALAAPVAAALAGLASAAGWLRRTSGEGRDAVEAGARRFALTLGRSLELALLVEQAAWDLARGDGRSAAAARRLAWNGVDRLTRAGVGGGSAVAPSLTDSRALANDEASAAVAEMAAASGGEG